MALSAGTRLGPYEILAPLGAGGMGEVYKARDTRLERTVAVKILPARFSEDLEMRQRFEREAKAISQLSHPHICALHDVGNQDGVEYLVMEYLEGETLADRLVNGPLPLNQMLRYGAEIADALDKAHRQGIVHRDLKPGNVMLTKTGVKLLDFGLAKAIAPENPTSDLTSNATAAARSDLTREGTILGTLSYIAPEQLEGKEADARTDVFALGATLYEMATGRKAFSASSRASLISVILRDEPAPISTIQPMTPHALDRVVLKCLAKDPEDRWQNAADLGSELKWLAESSSQTKVPMTVAARKVGRPLIAWTLAALFAALAVTALLVASRYKRGPEPLVFRQLNFRREAVFQAAFAAGGETVVYSAAIDGNTPQLFTVRPDYPEPQPLGRRGMHLLAVSSHGELAVLIGARYVWHRQFTGTLARMPLDGGAPREILEAVREADWSPDGSQLAIIREVGDRDRLEYPIGRVLGDGAYMTDVRVSPRGDLLAYFEHPRKWDDRGSVNIVDLAGNNFVLSEGYWSERGLAWSPNGEEVLFSASLSGGSFTVYAVTLSGKRRIAYQAPGGLTIQDVARDGRWLATRLDYRYAAMVHTPGNAADRDEDRDLSWLNTSHARALSQDGHTLLFAETALGTNYAVCLRKTDGSPVVRLGEGWPADLSADGKLALAVVSRPPQLVIYPTGAGETQQLKRGEIENYVTAQWFRDGKSVLINGNEPGKNTRFYVQEVGGTAARPVTPEGTRDGWLSADGKLVLARGPDGKYSVYPISGGEPRPVPGLTEADVLAQWSADGRAVLVYRRAEIPCRLERVDLASGHRTLFKEFAPADRNGLLSMREIFVTDDLRSFAYTAYYQVSSLFISEGRQ